MLCEQGCVPLPVTCHCCTIRTSLGPRGSQSCQEKTEVQAMAYRSLFSFCKCPQFTYGGLFFFFFWLCLVFIAARGLSVVAASGGYSSLRCTGFSLRWLLSLQSMGSRCTGFSSCGMQAQKLWLPGLVAPWHVGSSRTWDRTRVPCIGRRVLNHCTTREGY